MSWLLEQLRANQVLSGLIGGSLFASALYCMKELPGATWRWLTWRFTCSLTVFNEDNAFGRVNEWLSSLEYAKHCRRLRLTTSYDEVSGEERETLAPGVGNHLLWYRGRPVIVSRTLPDKAAVGHYKRLEDIRISSFGSSPEFLRGLVAEISEMKRRFNSRTVDVFHYRNRWRLACRKAKRAVETVVLPKQQKADIIADLERFFAARAWYAERGVPYRRGLLLEGPPGCGKTSLALALAGHFSRPIYSLNLGSIANDEELIDAVCDVPDHGILLIEDIDAASIGNRRAKRKGETGPVSVGSSSNKSDEVTGATLSGLLNVIDGVISREGRLLIMTTNYPERLDDALIRPGRADRREVVGPLSRAEGLELFYRFYPEERADRFLDSIQWPAPAAVIQEALLRRREASVEVRKAS